ncbi:hypothetical protein Tco_1200606 [Tanacetum coccineum]
MEEDCRLVFGHREQQTGATMGSRTGVVIRFRNYREVGTGCAVIFEQEGALGLCDLGYIGFNMKSRHWSSGTMVLDGYFACLSDRYCLDVVVKFVLVTTVCLEEGLRVLNGWKNLEVNMICNHLRSEMEAYLVVIAAAACAGAGAGAEAWFFLSKSNARTISLSSATSDETAWVEEFVLKLAKMP